MDFFIIFCLFMVICIILQLNIYIKNKKDNIESIESTIIVNNNNNNNSTDNNSNNKNNNNNNININNSNNDSIIEITNNDNSSNNNNKRLQLITDKNNPLFKKFQNKYLIIYLLAMASDWLQGPYVYALYESYGFGKKDIAILFIFGFLSSLVFGMVVGPIIDKYGRKFMGIVFGILYSLSCLTKVYNNFSILLFGRLLGGISTSLLFSVFESWMIAEHNSNGFSEELLSSTFYKSTLMNGIIAILSGLWASECASRWGYVSPFLWALGLLIICSILIATQWNENYGDSKSSLSFTFKAAFNTVSNDPAICSLGLTQALFEASMYTFVFLWTPTLSESPELKDIKLPFGLIFATFMVCVMIGSSFFTLFSKVTPETLLQYILIISSSCFIIPCLFKNSFLVYISFLIFEVCCGLYFPCLGTLRSKYIPESIRATTMNLFRVPLNLLVVISLTNTEKMSTSGHFFALSLWLLLALAHYRYYFIPSNHLVKTSSNNK